MAMTAKESAVMALRDRGQVATAIARRLGVDQASVRRIIAIYGNDAMAEYRARQAAQARGSAELLEAIERAQAMRGVG